MKKITLILMIIVMGIALFSCDLPNNDREQNPNPEKNTNNKAEIIPSDLFSYLDSFLTNQDHFYKALYKYLSELHECINNNDNIDYDMEKDIFFKGVNEFINIYSEIDFNCEPYEQELKDRGIDVVAFNDYMNFNKLTQSLTLILLNWHSYLANFSNDNLRI